LGDLRRYAFLSRSWYVFRKKCNSICPNCVPMLCFKLLLLQRLPDGVRLRGDIHVLLLGDPSTAKSQASIWCCHSINNVAIRLICRNLWFGCEKYCNSVWVIRHYFTWIIFCYWKPKVSGSVTLMCLSTVPQICREDCTYCSLYVWQRIICSWSYSICNSGW
jgi:hypothetical protein